MMIVLRPSDGIVICAVIASADGSLVNYLNSYFSKGTMDVLLNFLFPF